MSIKDKLEALKADYGRSGTADGAASLTKAMETLIAAEERSRPLRPGDVAPSFTLADAAGETVSSRELLDEGPLVVTFYRSLWCPYCQRDIEAFRRAIPSLRAGKASVVAISREGKPERSAQYREVNTFGFPVLEDRSGDVAVSFGIRWAPDEMRVIDACLETGIVSFRGTEPWIVPMQARFVVRQDGHIAYAEIAYDYGQRSEPDELLAVIGLEGGSRYAMPPA